MNDDLGYELRTSWRHPELPDSELARLKFENRRLRDALSTQSLIDQAKGIVMATRRTDCQSAAELLTRAATTSHLGVGDLARAVVEVTSGAGDHDNPRAVDVAVSLLNVGADVDRRAGATVGRPVATTVDLRGTHVPRGAGDGG